MMDTTLNQPLCCTDPEAFEQVWSRVMGGRSSQITVKSFACENETTAEQQRPLLPEESMALLPRITEERPCSPMVPEENMPTLPCFGEISLKTLLETAILATVDGLEAYKKLERQLPLKLKPILLESLLKRKKVLNQLETSYFLLVGEDFLAQYPATTEHLYSPPVPADQRLRTLFRKTQELQLLFKQSALETEDVCFTTLFLQVDKELKEEISTLHRLLESLFWLRSK